MSAELKVDLFVQVRLSSSRLPNKAALQLGSRTCLGHVLDRCGLATTVRLVVVCTSDHAEDGQLSATARHHRAEFFRGDLDNCLQRFADCAGLFETDIVVRVCGDSPLVDPATIDCVIRTLVQNRLDYARAVDLPVGTYVEVFTVDALRAALNASVDPSRSDDLTHFLCRPEFFRVGQYQVPPELRRPDLVLALNRPEDVPLLEAIFAESDGPGRPTLCEAIHFCSTHPALASSNLPYVPAPTRCNTAMRRPSISAATWPRNRHCLP